MRNGRRTSLRSLRKLVRSSLVVGFLVQIFAGTAYLIMKESVPSWMEGESCELLWQWG